MSCQDSLNNESLVPSGRRDLASAPFANSLVSRGCRDLGLTVPTDTEDALFYINRGSVMLFKKQYDEALADYHEAIRRDPTLAGAYNLRGLTWYCKGDYSAAIADYCQGIFLSPSFAPFYLNRGNAWLEQNEFPSAIADFDRAIQIDPDYYDAYKNRGLVWWSKKEYDKAANDFETALGSFPKTATRIPLLLHERINWFDTCDFDIDYSDWDESDIAIQPDSEKARVYHNRALDWLWIWDKYDEAAKDLAQASRLDPKNAQIYRDRGLVWLAMNERERAFKDFDEAIRIDPVRILRSKYFLDSLFAWHVELIQFLNAQCQH